MDDDWITVSFVPAAPPFVVHIPDIRGTGIRTQRVTGWLVQHQHDRTDQGTPVRSRVIPGVFNTKTRQIDPITIATGVQLLEVYPPGEAGEADLVDTLQRTVTSRRGHTAARIGPTGPSGGRARSLLPPPPPIHAHQPPRPSPRDIMFAR